ncbi:glutamate formimidoyltransferase [Flavobacteriaceae bacterium]|jgi:glutamate formiminotransferase/formiminotetrahydrofolate cyclodeaminase|nr:glutamate formimidoyltransferase [Bacteroidota bacterium]MDB2471979.1 glutamate formimidoyltransferase [Flavobacteriaceae bacterium]MDB2612478.1 glutamate formimidoyltransferase [Flavobacteriaceae bacterium]MDC3181431.1 glutamate formimidoyltransferase [Flavobacteriaceae bacterium]MDC3242666.1 glutamate formimidoyltransferase [Flavobacteriaceae bacterium]
MQKQLIECVPNISEGRDLDKIKRISHEVETVAGVKLLDVDPGIATNRTVITFVGEPSQVIEAAFKLIKLASQLIDMSKHKGEHPRFGATDVCPLVPISGITLEETSKYAQLLGKRVGEELKIPVYLYENAARIPDRINLANCRSGEYEGLSKKLSDPDWAPDFGPIEYNNHVASTGATAISARDFLVAYNVNLNTTSTRRANAIAFDIREGGRVKRTGNPIIGQKVLDTDGNPIRIPGKLKAVKGIGWYIEEYGIAQISYNLTNISVTSMHEAFYETTKAAHERGLRVTGSEIIGLIPLKAMLDAADFFLKKQQRSLGISESEKIKIAVKSLGLDDLKPFNPKEKIIEYVLNNTEQKRLIDLTLSDFADETAGESMAPGGGSISAYVGVLGVSLGTMVANLSAHKPGWDENWETYSMWAEKGQLYQGKLLALVDEDTQAFNKIIEGFRLPKNSKAEKMVRSQAIEAATIYATKVPLEVMKTACESMEVMMEMAKNGLQNSLSDAGVGALCARTAVYGAYLNVRINAKDIKDVATAEKLLNEATVIFNKTINFENEIINYINQKI